MKSLPQILCSVDPRQIPRLSPCDDDIYAKFRESFPDLKVGALKEADLKSESAKKEWREFCEGFKHVEDYREDLNLKDCLQVGSSPKIGIHTVVHIQGLSDSS